MEKKPFYITTTLPYVNADPHVGFAMEIIRADVIARYKQLQDFEVFFNTGTDEHGAKIYEAAQKEGISPQEYVDRFAAKFQELKGLLNLSVDKFVRTTDAHHIAAAQEFWKRCTAAGDIEKKLYQIKYCTGCELEKTDSELDENGRCPIHLNRELEIREEENYFFKLSNYNQKLKEFYESNSDFVIPDFRFNEVRALLERGLEDFSISRLKEKMPWGVPVPGDEAQVMYVWFDALVNYISTLGWPEDEVNFKKFWEAGTPVQYCGKDNNRQQSVMWQAMLMSAGLPNTRYIVIDGFINSGGQKMSKSLGNVISPFEIIELFKSVTEFPEDVLRFVLLHDIPSFEDGDLTIESIKASYTAHLANGLGNLVSRIMTMAENTNTTLSNIELEMVYFDKQNNIDSLETFDIQKFISEMFGLEIKSLDGSIQKNEPFKKMKTNLEEAKKEIHTLLYHLYGIGLGLAPVLPRTSGKIIEIVKSGKKPETPLFARLS